jgi:hypothetical protein
MCSARVASAFPHRTGPSADRRGRAACDRRTGAATSKALWQPARADRARPSAHSTRECRTRGGPRPEDGLLFGLEVLARETLSATVPRRPLERVKVDGSALDT